MMTPEIQQSIHILQLSSYELSQYLQEQALENPVLEIESYTGSYSSSRKSLSGTAFDSLAIVKAGEESLEQRLLSQMRITKVSEPVYKIAAFMAGNLDEAGNLTLSITEVSAFMNRPKEQVEEALACLQSLDPAGVGARSLQECLLLQIARDPSAKPGAYQIVSQHLQQLAEMKLDKIAQQTSLTLTEVKEIALYIRSLNPRPGLVFSQGNEPYMIPDAVIFLANGEIVIELNPSAVPKLSVNHAYGEKLPIASCSEVDSFLKDKWKSANWIVRSLEQRKVTMYRVIQAIFEEQTAFLEIGVHGIKPLNLKMISEKLGLHESTISRTVQNKFIRTPRGVFELKYFFSSGLQTGGGELASMKTIKARIKELISQENKKMPYSDQKIAEVLAREDIVISRRTVTKYREELHILSSSLRKSIL